MRILILSNFGMGLYKFKGELIEELLLQGMEVYLSLPKDEYTDKLITMGCHFIETPIDRRGMNPFRDLLLLLRYITIIRRKKPKIVLTFTIKPNLYGGMACRLTKTPYIATITGLGSVIENPGIFQTLTYKIYKISLKRASCVYFQNEPNRLLFIKKKLVKGNTIRISGSGINLMKHPYEEYPSEEDAIRFLFIGRIMKEKGIEELLQAAGIIKKRYPEVQIDLVGFYEEDYEKQILEYVNRGLINYLGRQEEVDYYIRKAHAIVLPSYHEGMSNVLQEGAASGRPVLASRITGCTEIFEEGRSGMGFEVKDVNSLVEVMIRFIELPYETKKAMGLAGRKKMEQEFDRNMIVKAYMEVINRVNSD